MVASSAMSPHDVDLDALEQEIRSAGRPVHINVLARAVAQPWSSGPVKPRRYAPGSGYRRGEKVLVDKQAATVKATTRAENPVQGSFRILTLALPDGTKRYKAAKVKGAPTEPRQTSPIGSPYPDSIGDSQRIRTVVGIALGTDRRFASFQDPQGDQWCLVEMLPEVGDREISRALGALSSRLKEGEPVSLPTAELVRAVWRIPDDGGAEYALHAFALGRALSVHPRIQHLVGLWIRAEVWDRFTRRTRLRVPRVASEVEIPLGVTPVVGNGSRHRPTPEAPPRPAPDREDDLESWRSSRPLAADLVLRAHHYYEGWLPLTAELGPLFPPFRSAGHEILLHHHFGAEAGSLRTWVDRRDGRVWVSQRMYDVFRGGRIYPGARLRITARSEREYDLATQPASTDEPIRVWRMWLNKDNKIEYSDDQEPRRYDIDDDVFVADVRFEDLGALFHQAAQAGNSIFGLMYRQACQRWEAGGRQRLHVTAEELHDALHRSQEGRMTSKATIAWELWQRLAFEPLGGGTYLFRPEYGDQRRLMEGRVVKAPQGERRRQRGGADGATHTVKQGADGATADVVVAKPDVTTAEATCQPVSYHGLETADQRSPEQPVADEGQAVVTEQVSTVGCGRPPTEPFDSDKLVETGTVGDDSETQEVISQISHLGEHTERVSGTLPDPEPPATPSPPCQTTTRLRRRLQEWLDWVKALLCGRRSDPRKPR